MTEDERYERERAFHDREFGERSRRSVDKFYAITESSRECYRGILGRFAPNKAVLEYGCGPGSEAFFLAGKGARVTGIDISGTAIQQASEAAEALSLSDARFVQMNAEQLEFEDASFDLVCGTGILHHLDLARAFGEVARVLKSDGRAVFVEPLGHNPLINLYRRRTPELRTRDEHPLTSGDLQLAKGWFDSVDTRSFHLSSLAAVPLRSTVAFSPLVRMLDAFDQALFRAVPPARQLAWQVLLVLSAPRVP